MSISEKLLAFHGVRGEHESVHGNDLIEVRHSGKNPDRRRDQLCGTCIESTYEYGELSAGITYQYIKLK
jgi:hypothetical protein